MPDQMNPMLQQLFQQQQNNQMQVANPFVTKGSLVMFKYSFWIHDPMPLVIITDYSPGFRMRGVNLHYLTYPYIRNLLSSMSAGFSYQNVKADSYISNSFRSYKWNGISSVKKFDSQFILKMMAMTRSIDPAQIHAIRQSIDQQLQQQYIEKAQPTA